MRTPKRKKPRRWHTRYYFRNVYWILRIQMRKRTAKAVLVDPQEGFAFVREMNLPVRVHSTLPHGMIEMRIAEYDLIQLEKAKQQYVARKKRKARRRS